MKYLIQEIAPIVNGNLLSYKFNAEIHKIVYDSRIATKDDSSLFVAIKGSIDGHAFIEDAYEKGIHSFLISRKEVFDSLDDSIKLHSNIILCNDGIEALQKLAIHHRQQYNFPVLGISGSNGKTIVKEWLYHILYEDMLIHRSPKSFNSQLGVPISVLGFEANCELGIIEAGISKSGEMQKLEKIVKPDWGLLTNIGSAHEEGFESDEKKLTEKLLLFKDSKKLYFCHDQATVGNTINLLVEKGFFQRDMKLISWGSGPGADLRITSQRKQGNETIIDAEYKSHILELSLPFGDDASIINCLHCWNILLDMGVDQSTIAKRMKALTRIEMRLELKEGINHCTLINDTYNSDIQSLSIALDVLNQQNQHTKKSIILSDILQSGHSEKELYKEVAHMIEQKQIDRIFGIGPALYRQQALFGKNARIFESINDFFEKVSILDFSNEALLVKGARKFSFEKIVRRLQKKVHSTVLEINLQHIIHNLNVYRSLLKPGTKIMVMVKAFSYGSGSYEIANILQYQNVDYLAVAYPDEGADLRKSGIKTPIMVMNPDPESFNLMLEQRLEPEIYSFRILHKLIAEIKSSFFKDEVSIHLKLETGMNRLGFNLEELPELIKLLEKHSYLKVKSVFTHLASSDFKGHDDFTKQQIDSFYGFATEIEKQLGYPVIKHVLNSAGIVRFPENQFDMVRLGLGLYGVDSSEILGEKLLPVSAFKSYISQIKEVNPGQSIGYMRKGSVNRKSKIATIAIGYADGYSRLLGNGKGKVWIKGKAAKTIGNVCMDMTMIDVTDLSVEEGDEVVIFDSAEKIGQMAASIGSIPYEVLTSISQRVKRVYYKE